MHELTDCSDSKRISRIESVTGIMPKVEILGYDDNPSQNINMGDNGASSSGTNIRSSLLGMGFSPFLVDKAIRENGEDNIDLLLETLFTYPAVQTPKPEPSDSANGLFNGENLELASNNRSGEALQKSNAEPSDSLDSLFDDDGNSGSHHDLETGIFPKEEPDDDISSDAHFDKKASLLMMNFSVEEVQHAMATLGEDVPVHELVDFIFAAQFADKREKSTDQLTGGGRVTNEDSNTEALFGTMDKTLRLLEMGFSENEISVAIEKYGTEIPIAELADSIVIDQLNGTSSTYSLNRHPYCSVKIKTEDYCQDGISQFELMERFNGKRPKEELIDESNIFKRLQDQQMDPQGNLKRPKQEHEELSSTEPVPLWLQARLGTYKSNRHRASSSSSSSPIVSQRRLNHKRGVLNGFTKPDLPKPKTCRSLDLMVAKPPYFLYGNIMNLSQDSWNKISQFLYAIEPEFVNTQYFSALSRKEGYVHNLPIENRFHILPKSPMTIEEAIPHSKKYWPSWDTRKQLSCISTETSGISLLCERLGRILIDSRGMLSVEQQRDLLHQCKTSNLVWVGRNKLGPIEPEHLEKILGYPVHHTESAGFGLAERLQSLKHCFQTDTLGYHISALKSLFPDGIRVLSIYSGVGGAEITLHRIGIRLKSVVSVEPEEIKRNILKKWWENSGQRGELVQMDNIQKLSSNKVESFMKKFGGFDFIICQNPYTYSSKGPTIAADNDSLAGLDFSQFYEFVRVLQRVRSMMGTSR